MKHSAFALTAFLVILAVAVAHSRTWTSRNGQHSLEAEMTGYEDGKVLLSKDDGSAVAVPLEKLSAVDQRFVREQLRKQREAGNAGGPPAPDGDGDEPTHEGADQGWPQWRGPLRNGLSLETGLMDKWSDQGPPILWQAQGLGSGYSSVAVTGGRVFTMGKRQGGEHLIALNATDGQEVWSTLVGRGDPSNCTPTVDGDLVFALGFDGDLLCANANTGQAMWRKNYAKDFGGRMMSHWGYSESPLVDGDRLICTPGAQRAMVVALDKRTGRTLWKTAMPVETGQRGKDGAGYSSVVVSQAAGVRQYVQLVGRGLISVRASDGNLLWGYNRIANDTANIPTPIVQGDYIFCSSGYGTGAALLKVAGSQKRLDVEEVYFLESNRLQNHHGGMLLLDGHIYCGHGHNQGHPMCLDMMSGKTAWGPGRGPGKGSAAIVYADGHLYFRYENGVMALIEASPRRYNLKGQFRIASQHDKSWPHPVIVDGRLYLRDQHELHCYNIREI